jgi:hypothetical protein
MNHGGSRPGAGRKPAPDPRTVRVMVRLTVGEAEAIDGARGTLTRSDALRELALKGIGAR